MTIEELVEIVGKGENSAWVNASRMEIRAALETYAPSAVQRFENLCHIHNVFVGGITMASQEIDRLRAEVERLRTELERISEYDSSGPDGISDEWAESIAFTACQRIAAEAINTEFSAVLPSR